MSIADDNLKCYHCTKETRLVDGKNKTTIHEFNSDTDIEKCKEITCPEDTDQCYEVTDKGSSEDTSTSVYFGCFTSKDAVCGVVSAINTDRCKNDWTWDLCDEDLCNKGYATSPTILAIVLIASLILNINHDQ